MALFSITLAFTPPASALDATSALTPIEEHGIFSENSPNYWEANPILSPENRQILYQWRQVQVIALLYKRCQGGFGSIGIFRFQYYSVSYSP